MKKVLFTKLYFIISVLILEVLGAKKKGKANNNKNNNNNNNNVQDDNKVKAESSYCDHLRPYTLYLDRNKLKELDNNQYINKDLSSNEGEFLEARKLDYFIRYSLISRGFCYYKENEVKELNKFDKFTIEYKGQSYQDTLRYDKTFNCYYYYDKYIHEDSREELEKHSIALNHCSQYIYGIYSFIYNEKLCPDPEPDMKGTYDNIQDPEQRKVEYYNQRGQYIREINDFYKRLNQTYHTWYSDINEFYKFETDLEYDTSNLELTLCGYPTQQQKNEYCKGRGRNDNCCSLGYNVIYIKYKFYKEPFYYGVAVSSVLIIIGAFFSSRIVKEIQMQENIKKSIQNQEKEYQESNEYNLLNAYKEGFDPKAQTFNSNSRNLNGTLRPGRNVGTMSGSEATMGINSNSRLTMGGSTGLTMGTGGMTLRNGGSMGRYPPNSFNVAEDYDSSDARDISLKRGMIVQVVQKFEGGWVMVKDIQSNRQGYAPEYCLGNKMA